MKKYSEDSWVACAL